jgi:hypothetical protein
LPDPIYFEERLKVTVQRIGAWDHGLFERQDNISTTAYWYLSEPSTAIPIEELLECEYVALPAG